MKNVLWLICLLMMILQNGNGQASKQTSEELAASFHGLQWRNIGPFRGGRSNAVSGVPNDPLTYYFGGVGGGVWKTEDAGISWKNISDQFFKSGSIGAIAVADSDPNVVYVGTGEHAVRGVMTSQGDGMYKSTDAGKTWKQIGLPESRHIAAVRIHPQQPDVVYVAVQGALHNASPERGIYRTTDGGATWKKIFYVDENTGAADLSMDINNPRVLYATMWEHRRYPWKVVSGGKGSAIYKSVDGGETWQKLTKGLPTAMGKAAISVSAANSKRVYANIEAEKGGVYRSDDGGETWTQTNSDRVTIARAWYYTEIFADPKNEEVVYVLNAPMLKSIDGGRTFRPIPNPHSDQHDLWINPQNTENIILGNDGGACISFNGGKSWSSQQNQPTAQFYRVITDNRFPYHVYAGQQDNSTVATPSRTNGAGIGWKDWYIVSGGESAFLAFDPNRPRYVFGGSYQGNISVLDQETNLEKDIMAYPVTGLAMTPKEMRYRFNWNAPIVVAPQDPKVIYHAGNVVLRSIDNGQSWTTISGDLTRNDKSKQGVGGEPYTNEGAGGENYNTISYLAASPHQQGVLWVGSDCGLVHLTKDDGNNWSNVTPTNIGEALINTIEVSPHDPATAYLAVNKYKFGDMTPMIYVTNDFGKTWKNKINGIANTHFVRVVREDVKRKGLLYAGTEAGLYISFNNGDQWHKFQLNLPICPITDLTIRDNDLVAATSGRAFWILDDLSALQQTGGQMPKTLQIFEPKPTYKFNISTPSETPSEMGANPASGVIFDYYLPEGLDSLEVKLEVLNSDNQVIRTYSSKKDETFKTFTGGPPAPKVLPAKKGINRFNWDLRRETLPAVQGVFMLGSYQGGLVAPGIYTLRLSANGQTATAKATVQAHPHLSATVEDYQQQTSLLIQIEQTVRNIHESVNKMRSIKTQMEEKEKLLRDLPQAKALIDSAKVIISKITIWEEQLIQPKQKTFQDVINFENQLNADLMDLRDRVDMFDPKPTKGATERFRELSTEWANHQKAMQDLIQKDVAAFNIQYQQLLLPAVVVPN